MWNWAEKLVSATGERWNQAVLTWRLEDIRPRGRPKRRWHDVLNIFLEKVTGRIHRTNDWQKAASDASTWKSLAKEFEKDTSLN